jgi:two-component system sensor histidine kinase/response regulator
MKLRKLSVWFSVGGLLILGANMLGMTLVEQAYTRMMDAQAHRQQSIQLSSELQQETEQLARLVRAYTTTGESRYLFYYYDILAVRLGEKPAPVTRNPLIGKTSSPGAFNTYCCAKACGRRCRSGCVRSASVAKNSNR